jgi:hypothetical protein
MCKSSHIEERGEAEVITNGPSKWGTNGYTEGEYLEVFTRGYTEGTG